MAAARSTAPYAAVGSGAKWFSPIHPVANGTSESQKRRCRFAHRILALTPSLNASSRPLPMRAPVDPATGPASAPSDPSWSAHELATLRVVVMVPSFESGAGDPRGSTVHARREKRREDPGKSTPYANAHSRPAAIAMRRAPALAEAWGVGEPPPSAVTAAPPMALAAASHWYTLRRPKTAVCGSPR